MTSRLIGTALLALVVAAPGAQGQRAGGPPRPKRAVIVTGENSYNGHVWKDTKALKVPGTAEIIRRGTAWAASIPVK
jgi:hypothetical protein